MGQSHSNIKPCRLDAKLAGLEKDLDLPSSDVYDWELILGIERGHPKVYKNAKIQDLNCDVAYVIK